MSNHEPTPQDILNALNAFEIRFLNKLDAIVDALSGIKSANSDKCLLSKMITKNDLEIFNKEILETVNKKFDDFRQELTLSLK